MLKRVSRWIGNLRHLEWPATAARGNLVSAPLGADNPEEYLRTLPFDETTNRRIRMTIGCDDSRNLPKVRNAGRVFADGTTRYQLMHNGIKVIEDGYCGRWMTELIRLLRGHHEPQEERAFHEVLRHLGPKATMVELGSNWAFYSLWFAQAVAGARNVLVEPDPSNLQVGRRNFELNGARATGEFHQYSIGRTSAQPRPFVCESDRQQHLIPEISVDDLVDRLALPRVDLLLADIQGAELAMLEGAMRTIAAGRLRFVFLSTHHHSISGSPLTHQECLGLVRGHGGHVLVEHNVTESYSGDGLIVASFDPADRGLPPIHVSRNYPSNSLFRELDYDLDEAWKALTHVSETLRELAGREPRLAEALNALRCQNNLLGRSWPPFLPAEDRHTARACA